MARLRRLAMSMTFWNTVSLSSGTGLAVTVMSASLWAPGRTCRLAMAASIALPLSLAAARNTTWSQVLRFFTRRGFDTLRGDPEFVELTTEK